jgi:hypothetical protein
MILLALTYGIPVRHDLKSHLPGLDPEVRVPPFRRLTDDTRTSG